MDNAVLLSVSERQGMNSSLPSLSAPPLRFRKSVDENSFFIQLGASSGHIEGNETPGIAVLYI